MTLDNVLSGWCIRSSKFGNQTSSTGKLLNIFLPGWHFRKFTLVLNRSNRPLNHKLDYRNSSQVPQSRYSAHCHPAHQDDASGWMLSQARLLFTQGGLFQDREFPVYRLRVIRKKLNYLTSIVALVGFH